MCQNSYMEINIPTNEQQKLALQAAAHGYATVDAFVSELLTNVASLSDQATVFAPLTDEQRSQSEELVRRGEDDLAAGRVQDMRQALQQLGRERGLTLGE